MKYRNLGKTELNVSRIGLGGNIYGRFINKAQTAHIIDAAKEAGINFIDTADVYSDGLSEEYIGAAVSKNRDQFIIATKVGVKTGESPKGKGQKAYILKKVAGSLKRLSTDYIDLLYMHHFDPVTPIEETMRALQLVIKQGKVRYIGASNYSEEMLKKSNQIARTCGLTPFSVLQTHYNLFKRELEGTTLSVCRSEKIGIAVYGVLARGILSGKYHTGHKLPAHSRALVSKGLKSDLTAEVLTIVAKLEAFAKKHGKSVSDLAIAWALREDTPEAAIIGVRNIDQLRANVDSVGITLSVEEIMDIEKIIGNVYKFRSLQLGGFNQW